MPIRFNMTFIRDTATFMGVCSGFYAGLYLFLSVLLTTNVVYHLPKANADSIDLQEKTMKNGFKNINEKHEILSMKIQMMKEKLDDAAVERQKLNSRLDDAAVERHKLNSRLDDVNTQLEVASRERSQILEQQVVASHERSQILEHLKNLK